MAVWFWQQRSSWRQSLTYKRMTTYDMQCSILDMKFSLSQWKHVGAVSQLNPYCYSVSTCISHILIKTYICYCFFGCMCWEFYCFFSLLLLLLLLFNLVYSFVVNTFAYLFYFFKNMPKLKIKSWNKPVLYRAVITSVGSYSPESGINPYEHKTLSPLIAKETPTWRIITETRKGKEPPGSIDESTSSGCILHA